MCCLEKKAYLETRELQDQQDPLGPEGDLEVQVLKAAKGGMVEEDQVAFVD